MATLEKSLAWAHTASVIPTVLKLGVINSVSKTTCGSCSWCLVSVGLSACLLACLLAGGESSPHDTS